MQENMERFQVLQHLQRGLDPFQESPNAEKLRALGLGNLYFKMADPSLEYLETVAGNLAGIPLGALRQLRYDTYNAEANPKRFFAGHGIVVDDSEDLQVGIGNTSGLLDNLIQKYDYETQELNWGQELNPKALAESTHERIQIRKSERQIREAIEQVQNEPDVNKRYRMGFSLKRQLLDYTSTFPFSFYRRYDRDNPIEPTWENLTQNSGLSIELETKDGGTTMGGFSIEEAVDAAQAVILRYPFEKRLSKLPTRDHERFDQLRFEYGAKAANLIVLSELVGDINRLRKDSLFGVKIAVPDFQTVPVDSYRAWREGKLIDDLLQPYFDWAGALQEDDRRYWDDPSPADYIVRSSAVFSEDGETVTGAGVYESVRVHGGATFEDFKGAVERVYESTESPQAQAYRAEHGIDREEMGLVIQKYVSPRDYYNGQSQEGYINSRLTGVPQLMEVVTETSRNFIKRKELEFFLPLDAEMNERAFLATHHFPPDIYKVIPDLPIRVAQLTYVAERIWGKDIQVEFVANGSTINFVQVRELPTSLTAQTVEIHFPDEQPVHTGASIGVGDMELPVLDNQDDNSEKAGIVIFGGNYGWTMRNNNYRLPKEGAVVIYSSDGRSGHIQTLCAEKGLVCIFPDVNNDMFAPEGRELSELKKVRVVSNGIEGRVYGYEE